MYIINVGLHSAFRHMCKTPLLIIWSEKIEWGGTGKQNNIVAMLFVQCPAVLLLFTVFNRLVSVNFYFNLSRFNDFFSSLFLNVSISYRPSLFRVAIDQCRGKFDLRRLLTGINGTVIWCVCDSGTCLPIMPCCAARGPGSISTPI